MNNLLRWKIILGGSISIGLIVVLSYVGILFYGILSTPHYANFYLNMNWLNLMGGMISTTTFCVFVGIAIGIAYVKFDYAKKQSNSGNQSSNLSSRGGREIKEQALGKTEIKTQEAAHI